MNNQTNSQEKTHYRKVFKSDHLGTADLEEFVEEGSDLVFTINNVKQEINAKVAGKKINANIAYFEEHIKPLVLNATNSKVLKQLSGSPFVEDWRGLTIKLYIDQSAKLKGEVVGGVRISPNKANKKKPELVEGTQNWTNAIAAYKRDGNLNAVLKHVSISEENVSKIIALAGAE